MPPCVHKGCVRVEAFNFTEAIQKLRNHRTSLKVYACTEYRRIGAVRAIIRLIQRQPVHYKRYSKHLKKFVNLVTMLINFWVDDSHKLYHKLKSIDLKGKIF